MSRTILIHINVEAADDDARNADEIGDMILANLELGLRSEDGWEGGGLESGNNVEVSRLLVTAPLVEEI